MAINDRPKMYWPMGKDAIIHKPQLYKDQDVLFTQSGYFILEEAKKVVESWSEAPSGLSDYWVQVFQGDNHLEDLREKDLGWNIQLTEKHPKIVSSEPKHKSHLIDDIEADNKRILDLLAEGPDAKIEAGMVSRDRVEDLLGSLREKEIVYPITQSILPEPRKEPLSWAEKLTASDRQQLAESSLPSDLDGGEVVYLKDDQKVGTGPITQSFLEKKADPSAAVTQDFLQRKSDPSFSAKDRRQMAADLLPHDFDGDVADQFEGNQGV